MKKFVKNVIAFVMSFAMVICLSSPAVRAEEVSMQDDGIALQNIVMDNNILFRIREHNLWQCLVMPIHWLLNVKI